MIEKYIKRNKIREIFARLCFRLLNKIERNNNSNPYKNGEFLFIERFSRLYPNKDKIIIFDIGANNGKYSKKIIDIRKKNYELHLFEPQRQCYEILKKKFLDIKYVNLNNFGLSDKNSDVWLYKDKEGSGLASLYQRNFKIINKKMDLKEKISLKKPSDYIKENKIKKINLVKIDIEGNETKCLEGFEKYLSKNYIDFIQFEYGGCNLDSKTTLFEIFTFLENAGFIITKIMPKNLEKREYKPYMENFSYANYLAISQSILKNKF